MNKKLYVILAVLGIILIAIIALAAVNAQRGVTPEPQDTYTVSFSIDTPDATITVRDTADTVVTYSSDQRFQATLEPGTYYYWTTGFETETVYDKFTVVDKDISITIHPGFTRERLDQLLPGEERAIKTAIEQQFPMAIRSYPVQVVWLFERGETAGVVMGSEDGSGDVYRAVLKKKGNAWAPVRTPELVLYREDYKDVPLNVLTTINTEPLVYREDL